MQSSSFVVVAPRGRSVGLDDHAKGVREERPPIGAEPGRRRRGEERARGGGPGTDSAKHLDDSRAEFPYRDNRRWMEATLVAAAVDSKSVPYKGLLTGAK